MPGAIDFMCYLFTSEAIMKYWLEQEEILRLVKWWHMEDHMKGYSVEEFVEKMDEAGVDKVCLVAVKMRSYKAKKMVWDTPIEEVTGIVQKRPDRFVGFAGFNPLEGRKALKEVERAIKEYGFKGVYIHCYGFEIPLNHRLFYPLYSKCAELGISVSMQVGHSAEHMPSELARPILLDDIAMDFPEVNFVGAHTGWPWIEEMIAMAWKHENVYIGIDAHHPKFLAPSLVQFMKTRGQDKVLWGTNYPGILHKDSLDCINKEMGLKDAVKEKILWKNAQKVFNL